MASFNSSNNPKQEHDSNTGDNLKGNLHKEKMQFTTSRDTGNERCVPNSNVTEWKGLESEKWFFGKIKRVDAEHLLMMPFNTAGSYLVRNNERTPQNYALSVRETERSVKHYNIKQLVNGKFCLGGRSWPWTTFQSVHDLVDHYQWKRSRLIYLLNPCIFSKETHHHQTADLPNKGNDSTLKWELNRRQVQLLKRLSDSRFGEVWEGLWNEKTAIAVKILKPGLMDSDEFLQEAETMKKLSHPKLIQLYGVCTQEKPIYIVTELMKHGSMLEYLRGDGRSLKLPQLIDMSSQVATGMAYLEEQNYIHRDLAARNILVGDNMNCKVASFRHTQKQSKSDKVSISTHAIFNIKWTAPEAAMYSRFTIKSDVWSFGIVLYEIITYGQSPYPNMTNVEVLERIQQGYHMPRPAGCPDELYENIMLNCWREDPASRPAFETLHWQLEEYFFMSP